MDEKSNRLAMCRDQNNRDESQEETPSNTIATAPTCYWRQIFRTLVYLNTEHEQVPQNFNALRIYSHATLDL